MAVQDTRYRGARIPPRGKPQRGLTLIEMMIALVLGLLVVGAATAVYLSNRHAYITNHSLGQVQSNTRIAFEMLARDIRQAGVTLCGPPLETADFVNILPGSSSTPPDWYADSTVAQTGILGYDDASSDPAASTVTGSGAPVGGTSSIQVIGAGNSYNSIPATTSTAPDVFSIEPTTTTLSVGDPVIVCEPGVTLLAQISSIAGGNVTMNGGTNPFDANSQISSLSAVDWYIGTNPQGGESLYRIALLNDAGTLTPTAQEMIRNVTGLQIGYLLQNGTSFVNAASVGTGWAEVVAVKLTLTLTGSDQRAGTDAKPLTRTLAATVNLRNRVSS